MLRDLLSLGNNAVSDLVGVLSLSAFRPAAELGVAASRERLGLRSGATAFRADQSAYVNFVSTVRAFHLPNNTTPNAYDA